jgi:hypothetical protein
VKPRHRKHIVVREAAETSQAAGRENAFVQFGNLKTAQ